GIFFDRLSEPESHEASQGRQTGGRHELGGDIWQRDFDFVAEGLGSLSDAYLPIVERRRRTAYGERELAWQSHRHGRYVEFNLLYDRGTLFGLQTGGNIEAILASLPPQAAWSYAHAPEPGSEEARLIDYLRPRDWLGDQGQGFKSYVPAADDTPT